MARSIDNWGDRMERSPVKTMAQIIIIIVGLIALIIFLGWTIIVIFSGVKGKGDARNIKNSADNWISAQQGFQTENNDYQSDIKVNIPYAHQQLDDFNKKYSTIPDGPTAFTLGQQLISLQGQLNGYIDQCVRAANSYNTDSHSYLTQDFKDSNMPTSLDPTQCK